MKTSNPTSQFLKRLATHSDLAQIFYKYHLNCYAEKPMLHLKAHKFNYLAWWFSYTYKGQIGVFPTLTADTVFENLKRGMTLDEIDDMDSFHMTILAEEFKFLNQN